MNTADKAFIYFTLLVMEMMMIHVFGKCIESGQTIMENQIRYELECGKPLLWHGPIHSIDLY